MSDTESPAPASTTELTVDQALQRGVAHHKAGQLPEAERAYRAILQVQPQHPDANHNLGVLAVGVGDDGLNYRKWHIEGDYLQPAFHANVIGWLF